MISVNGRVISKKERMCKSLYSQARGLMFRRRQNLVMEFSSLRSVSLHNFFVFYPIDVLVLDEKKRVVDLKKNFKPFTFWNSSVKGKYVVELAFGCDVEVGDRLDF